MIVTRDNLIPSSKDKELTRIKAYDLDMPISDFEKESEVWFVENDGLKMELRTKHVKISFLVFYSLSKIPGGIYRHHHTRTCLPHLAVPVTMSVLDIYHPRTLGFKCEVHDQNPFPEEKIVKHYDYFHER